MASNILLAKQSPTYTSNGDSVTTMVAHCKETPYSSSYDRKKYASSGKTAVQKDKLFYRNTWEERFNL